MGLRSTRATARQREVSDGGTSLVSEPESLRKTHLASRWRKRHVPACRQYTRTGGKHSIGFDELRRGFLVRWTFGWVYFGKQWTAFSFLTKGSVNGCWDRVNPALRAALEEILESGAAGVGSHRGLNLQSQSQRTAALLGGNPRAAAGPH